MVIDLICSLDDDDDKNDNYMVRRGVRYSRALK
jgi:hypothetical protein